MTIQSAFRKWSRGRAERQERIITVNHAHSASAFKLQCMSALTLAGTVTAIAANYFSANPEHNNTHTLGL